MQTHDYEHSFITNFHVRQEERYKKAIEKFPEYCLRIDDKATDGYGNTIDFCKSLHIDADPQDLSPFWQYFDSLKNSELLSQNGTVGANAAPVSEAVAEDLPPLPNPTRIFSEWESGKVDAYTAEQMHAYARALAAKTVPATNYRTVTKAHDLNGENPGVVLANELGVNMDDLHARLAEQAEENPKDYPWTVTLNQAEAKFLKACMEVACEY